MSDPSDLSPCSSLESALEAMCDALVTLEAIRMATPEETSPRPDLCPAIDSLQRAIRELRVVGREGMTSRLPRGFVVSKPRAGAAAVSIEAERQEGLQSRPWRTA